MTASDAFRGANLTAAFLLDAQDRRAVAGEHACRRAQVGIHRVGAERLALRQEVPACRGRLNARAVTLTPQSWC
jgi:hypothetical protein